jgi:phage terminase large subunit GpA-like protein
VPEGVTIITAGIDVQDDRIEMEVVGWGDDYESWCIDYVVIYGDPSAPGIWSELTGHLKRVYVHPDFGDMRIRRSCIDTGGHFTQQVYAYVRSRMQHRDVMPIKGVGGEGRPMVGRPSRNNIAKIPLFPIGVHTIKEVVMARLRVKEGEAGYCHFSIDRDAEYFKQMTAEKLVTRYHKGFKRREFQKTRTRNEVLDCRTYSTAALEMCSVDLKAQRIAMFAAKRKDETDDKETKPARGRRGSSFVNSWRDY